MADDETLKLDLLLEQFFDRQQGQFTSEEEYKGQTEQNTRPNKKPQNKNQRLLQRYFNGKVPLSASIASAYDIERNSGSFSDAVLAGYVEKSARRLKDLLHFMLRCYPAEIDLLCDLTFLHQYYPILKTVIDAYTIACVVIEDLEDFELLVENFQKSVVSDGFDAFTALKSRSDLIPEKQAIVDQLILCERNQKFLKESETVH